MRIWVSRSRLAPYCGTCIEKTSRRLAILQTFGPNPDAVFKTIKREIGLIHPEALKTKSKKLDLSYEGIRGKIYADTGTFYTVGSAVIQVHGMAQMAVLDLMRSLVT